MSVLVAIRGWRVSLVHASTKRTRSSHSLEHISRQSGLPQIRASSATSTARTGTLEQTKAVEEVKPSLPSGPARDEQTDLTLMATAEPEQSTKSLAADEKQIVVRMRKNAYSKLRIAEFLGRHLQVVHDAVRELGTIDSRISTVPRVRLPVPQIERIDRLQRRGLSWPAIRSQEHIDISSAHLRKIFVRQMKEMGRPLPITGRTKLTLSSADIQEIEKLREVRTSWTRIFELKFKGRPKSESQYRRLQRAYWNRNHQPQRPMPVLTAPELREITRLRMTKGYSWLQVARSLYPGYHNQTVHELFHHKMLDEDADPSLQDPNDRKATLLREEMKSWFQTTRSKYPGLYMRAICEELLKETWPRDGEGTPGREPRRRGLTMSTAEVQVITQLRAAGKTWPEITDLKFPGWDTRSVSDVFRKTTRNNDQPSARVKKGEKFEMTEAERLEVTRLRKERKTWPEIVELKFPAWSVETVKLHYSGPGSSADQTVGRRLFKPSKADYLDVALLRRQGVTWREITNLKFPEWSLRIVQHTFS
jgi:hypothetical protein